MSDARDYTPLDRLLIEFDHALHTACAGSPADAARENPARAQAKDELSDTERQLAARLMRVNHAGEVAAQALYRGQALTAHAAAARASMAQSAAEEVDHLAWCRERLTELDASASRFDPLWYAGSIAIGAAAGLAGDPFSLGFIAETERQVVAHLDRHLRRLPAGDHKSRAILEQMKTDEAHHGDQASRAGGTAMPSPVRALMHLTSKVMTETAYWI
ncbi:MAG: 2-polyprenyl-3-methyl-6-methoxy-1,4-benzoquinone monooxygenase [Gammaproteobacteria bacterium]